MSYFLHEFSRITMIAVLIFFLLFLGINCSLKKVVVTGGKFNLKSKMNTLKL